MKTLKNTITKIIKEQRNNSLNERTGEIIKVIEHRLVNSKAVAYVRNRRGLVDKDNNPSAELERILEKEFDIQWDYYYKIEFVTMREIAREKEEADEASKIFKLL
jgi:hypothetical protein